MSDDAWALTVCLGFVLFVALLVWAMRRSGGGSSAFGAGDDGGSDGLDLDDALDLFDAFFDD